MLVNNLLESSNNYKSMQEDAARLSQKWAKSGLLEGIADNRVKDNMAVILENQAKQIVAEANTTGTGGTFSAGAGEQWAGVALPLVRKVFASIVAQDFVSGIVGGDPGAVARAQGELLDYGEWNDLCKLAKTHPTLKKQMDKLVTTYYLVKENKK